MSATHAIPLYTAEALAGLGASVEFLVHDTIPKGGVCMLYGPSGVGKSAVMIDLAHAVATGQPFCGRETTEGSVLYIAGEGAGGLGQRVIASAKRRFDGDLAQLARMRYVIQPVGLDDATEVAAVLTALAQEHHRPDLVIVDTLAANALPGFNENDAKDMACLLDGAVRLNQTLGSAVLFVHHTGWNETRERGSSAIRGRCDVVLAASRAGTNQLTLSVEKSRDFAKPIPLTLEIVEFEGSIVLGMAARPAILTLGQRQALEILQDSSTALTTTEWQKRVHGRYGMQRSAFYYRKSELAEAELVTTGADSEKWVPTSRGVQVLAAEKTSTEGRQNTPESTGLNGLKTSNNTPVGNGTSTGSPSLTDRVNRGLTLYEGL